jgi:hypothetical protein
VWEGHVGLKLRVWVGVVPGRGRTVQVGEDASHESHHSVAAVQGGALIQVELKPRVMLRGRHRASPAPVCSFTSPPSSHPFPLTCPSIANHQPLKVDVTLRRCRHLLPSAHRTSITTLPCSCCC